jgi:DNA-binding NarL/FixJ family response regulator
MTAQTQSHKDSRRNAELTKREEEVLALARDGFSNKKISERMGISMNTVRGYLRVIYRKKGVQGRKELQK